MPRLGFEVSNPGPLVHTTKCSTAELSGLPSKQSVNLAHSPSLSISEVGHHCANQFRHQWPTIETGLPSKVGHHCANEFL